MRLVTDRQPVGDQPYAAVTLDPATQTARYFDPAGQPMEMGKHGTSRRAASFSGGGDGQNPQPQSQDDNTTDFESD
jgi:putative ATP-grasp target RiPP